jgi:hypothetical protein
MNSVTFMRPDEASKYLSERWGLRATVKTLAKWRVVGGGPRFRCAGRNICYAPAELDSWANSRISTTSFASTAEAKALTVE